MAMRRQPSRAAGSAGELVTAKRTLESLQLGLLPAELVDQIFGERDLTYVATIGSNEIRSLFLSERKRLALDVDPPGSKAGSRAERLSREPLPHVHADEPLEGVVSSA